MSVRSSLRLQAYRWLQRQVIEPGTLRWAFAQSRGERERINRVSAIAAPAQVWFHAASVGELEALWPVIERATESVRSVAISVFSDSARAAVRKLAESLQGKPAQVSYAGVAPWEGRWGAALDRAQPEVLVTAKYEAWPELWGALAERDVPLVILGAQWRPSLRWAPRACRWLGSRLPRILFLAAHETEASDLRGKFPRASAVAVGDPRWDRVFSRGKAGSPRARALAETYSDRPRPWGALAQVWPEDLAVWKESIRGCAGTLWVIPHKIGEPELARITSALEQAGVSFGKTSLSRSEENANVLLVDEMGVLLELYSKMDWAYVGGGFGAGVHSTIEPAITGIPISSGKARAERFAEITELRASGQLTLIETAADARRWLREGASAAEGDRLRWRSEAHARLGATGRAWQEITRFVTSLGPC